MLKILTPALLNILQSWGYMYCLSRTTNICGDGADICITLLPVKYEPDITELPENYDTYFELAEEPLQMAQGIDEAIVLVDLTSILQRSRSIIYEH